jgi:two-component system response regulator FixJ
LSRPRSIFLVDDDPAVVRSTAALLSTRGFEVRTWPSAIAFLGDYDGKEPACLLLDVRMPGMSGLELQEKLQGRGAHLPIIIMTGHADVPMAVKAMRAGAADFIEKPFVPTVLWESLERVLRRGDQARVEPPPGVSEALDCLTERERDVLELLVRGHTNKAIAHQLEISQRTVEVHRARVKAKLKAQGLADLMRIMGR